MENGDRLTCLTWAVIALARRHRVLAVRRAAQVRAGRAAVNPVRQVRYQVPARRARRARRPCCRAVAVASSVVASVHRCRAVLPVRDLPAYRVQIRRKLRQRSLLRVRQVHRIRLRHRHLPELRLERHHPVKRRQDLGQDLERRQVRPVPEHRAGLDLDRQHHPVASKL